MNINNLIFFLTILVKEIVSWSGENKGEFYYQKALNKFEELKKITKKHPIYTQENIENNLYIPQYNDLINDYESNHEKEKNEKSEELILSIEKDLETSAFYNHSQALLTIADINIFGNYSIKTNYTKSKEYYHKVLEIEKNVHAYFMLGFIYSSGLAGEIPVDDSKATFYYKLASENGHVNAIFVMAYRYLYGIGMNSNCNLALHYYSRLLFLSLDYIKTEKENYKSNFLYNIKLFDFNGGIYGKKLSESPVSVLTKDKMYLNSKKFLEEYNLNMNEHEYIFNYYNALKYYEGDFFFEKNYTKSMYYLNKCISSENKLRNSSSLKITNKIDKIFLGRCNALLGHMYLKGYGSPSNHLIAQKYLYSSLNYSTISEALNDLGLINESQNITSSIEFYTEASNLDSNEARLSLAKIFLSNASEEDFQNDDFKKKIFQLIKKSVYGGNIEGLYHFVENFHTGWFTHSSTNVHYTCSGIIIYYKLFIEKLEKLFFPYLKTAFNELIHANYKNSLIYYMMGAESGLENAQLSTVYLLYQPQTFLQKYKKKVFNNKRIRSSIKYLELASNQKNIDATILLGDIYLKGINSSNIEKNHNKAFLYFKKASQQKSSHGSYKLGQMYEYKLGPVNKTLDYFMAKRYYDLSLKYKQKKDEYTHTISNKIPITLSLLRLKYKYLLHKKSFKFKLSDFDKSIWSNSNSNDEKEKEREKNKTEKKSNTIKNKNIYSDHLIIFFTAILFSFFLLQNLIFYYRRFRVVN